MLAELAPRLLLADSSARMRRVMRINLESAGYSVTECDGSDLSQRVRAAGFAVLVINLDARTPVVSAAIGDLRRRSPGAVVAGYSILPPDERIRHMAVDLYVETPFDVSRFAARLRSTRDRTAAAEVTAPAR